MRKLLLALAALAGVAGQSIAQPAPVPALPDSSRIATYNISGTTCACAVNFQLYGDGTDVDNWVQVFIGSTQVLSSDPSKGWVLTSPSGSIGAIARPITDAVLTFNAVQTGQVTIVGAQRPRRLSEFSENAGIPARNHNQVLNTLFAEGREAWDKTNRAILAQPGEVLNLLPPAASRSGSLLAFDGSGQPITTVPGTGTGNVVGPGGAVNNDLACFNGTTGALIKGCGFGSATANQIPVFPGSGGAATPTSATTWFDNAYCNTVGWAIVRLTGQWTCSKFIAANPVWWGADPTAASDSTSAFNSAFAASTAVEFPPGKFKMLSAITYNIPAGINSVTLKGGGQDVTILTWPNASGGITFNYAGINSSVHIRDLSLTTGTTNGGNAVTLNLATSVANPAVTAISDIYRVTMRGDDGLILTDYWSNGVNVVNVSNVQFENLAVFGPSSPAGQGINLIGLPASSTFGVQYNIAKSTFGNLATGIIYGSFIQGVTVDQSNFTADVNGIIAPSSQTGVLAQLAVTNSQFAATGSSIGTLTAVLETQITNNLFIQPANSTAINLVANNQFVLSANEISSLSTTGTTGISVGTTAGGARSIIAGNVISGFATGLNLQAASAGVNAYGNAFMANNVTNISNGGTNNFITNNTGYNPVGPSGITVTASPFTYTAGASPETVYVWNGTVSSVNVDKNGGALGTVACNTVPCTVDLGPFEQTKVTYTVAPNMNKMVH